MKSMLINGIILPFLVACILLYSVLTSDKHVIISVLCVMNFTISLVNLILLITLEGYKFKIGSFKNKRSWNKPDKPIMPTPVDDKEIKTWIITITGDNVVVSEKQGNTPEIIRKQSDNEK